MRVLLPLLTVLWVAAPAHATSYRDISLEQMTLRSTIVVEADVISQRFEPRGGKMPVATLTSLKVVRYLRGSGTRKIELWQPGGELNGLRYSVSGSPSIAPGQRVVLFLKPKPGYPSGTFYLFALELGAYDVRLTPNGSSWATRSTLSPARSIPTHDGNVQDPSPTPQSSGRLPASLPRWQLVSRIRGVQLP